MGPKKIVTIVVVSIAAVFGLWLTFASTVSVGTGEIAVMTRFGEVTGQELSEGLHLKNPLDNANIYDVKVLKEQSEAAAASKDLQDVVGTVVVNYRLEAGKVSQIHKTVGVDYKSKLIDPAIQEVFKASTAGYDATQLITDRSGVKNNALGLLKERLEPYGINIQDLSITNFSFSSEFTKAIEGKQVAAQEAERAHFNLERARLDAQAQELQKQSLSPLLLQKEAIQAWKEGGSKMPQYLVLDGDGNGLFGIPFKSSNQ